MLKRYCACVCSIGAVSGKRSWHILPNDKPAVDSSINYEIVIFLDPSPGGLTQTHSTFVLGILMIHNYY